MEKMTRSLLPRSKEEILRTKGVVIRVITASGEQSDLEFFREKDGTVHLAGWEPKDEEPGGEVKEYAGKMAFAVLSGTFKRAEEKEERAAEARKKAAKLELQGSFF